MYKNLLRSRPGRCAAALLLLAAACTRREQVRSPAPAPSGDETRFKIVFLGDSRSPAGAAILRGAELAAEAAPGGLRVDAGGPPTARLLASAAGDPSVRGVLTSGGGPAIAAAAEVLQDHSLPVFELSEDLYDAGMLGWPVFQAAIPHSWQAFRLARYFGPGDRRYRSVGVWHDGGPAGTLAGRAMKQALAERRVAMVEAAGLEGLAAIGAGRPQAVVVEGDPGFLQQALERLSAEDRAYRGRDAAGDGWRPQPAGFDSLMGAGAPEGAVAAEAYALPVPGHPLPEPVARFAAAYEEKFGSAPPPGAARGYEAVRALVAAAKTGAGSRAGVLKALEAFDRQRAGGLPLSLGPDDRLFPDRDMLGLWGRLDGRWQPLMRSFTSDLERTNIPEEDWQVYFEGTVPGGEAPFFHQAVAGITTGPDDDRL